MDWWLVGYPIGIIFNFVCYITDKHGPVAKFNLGVAIFAAIGLIFHIVTRYVL
jgi:hypothetical protein